MLVVTFWWHSKVQYFSDCHIIIWWTFLGRAHFPRQKHTVDSVTPTRSQFLRTGAPACSPIHDFNALSVERGPAAWSIIISLQRIPVITPHSVHGVVTVLQERPRHLHRDDLSHDIETMVPIREARAAKRGTEVMRNSWHSRATPSKINVKLIKMPVSCAPVVVPSVERAANTVETAGEGNHSSFLLDCGGSREEMYHRIVIRRVQPKHMTDPLRNLIPIVEGAQNDGLLIRQWLCAAQSLWWYIEEGVGPALTRLILHCLQQLSSKERRNKLLASPSPKMNVNINLIMILTMIITTT